MSATEIVITLMQMKRDPRGIRSIDLCNAYDLLRIGCYEKVWYYFANVV